MENTTIENAVDQLLSVPVETEAEEEKQEVSQIEEASAEEEQEEELELTDDDLEGENLDLSEQDLPEEDSTPDLYDVKSNGIWKKASIDELKQSYAGQDFIQTKMRENAEQAKQLEQERAQYQQMQQQALGFYQQLQQNGVQAPTPPDVKLAETDPIGYVEAQAQYDAAKRIFDQQQLQAQALHQQQQEQQQQAHSAYLREQAAILQQYIPEMADKEKSEVVKKQLFDVGKHYGFSAEEIGQVADARYFRALNDARKYRALVAKRGQKQKAESKIQPVKAGVKKKPGSQAAATREKQMNRLRKTGRMDDAIDLLLSPNN